MGKQITIEKITHRGEMRIKVNAPHEAGFKEKIKLIADRKWSQTLNCWHVPYSNDAYAALQQLFENIEVVGGQSESIHVSDTSETSDTLVTITQPAYGTFERDGEWQKMVVGQQIICDSMQSDWFILYIPFDKKGWINVVRNIQGRRWNVEGKYWQLPYVKESFRALKRHIGMQHLVFNFKINANIPDEYIAPTKPQSQSKKQYKKSFYEQLNEAQREAITLLVEKLTLARMSIATIKTYKHHLAGVLFYYKDFDPRDITVPNVQQYLLYQIRFKKIAESTQNQIISAVKAYWEKVLNRDKQFIQIPRPKKPRKLPNVLSTEEVVLLINATENLKHKLILLLIYSAGMRLGEVVNLLVRDININRRAIHIKAAKGKRDRYVTLAETVIPYLQSYKKQYQPNRWLFEGQYGGKYSKRSVQSIFKKALKKARVDPYATVHTLRHSYATHCIEDGHNLKSVQEALGHQSLKTTEVYLHISSQALKKLKSPIDKLNLK
ncbi:MAG: tyrosine-type recombinase/integrase [Saprospiraceae bacterium]